MDSADGSIRISVTMDTEEAEKQLDNFSDKATGRLRGALSTVGKVGVASLAAVGTATVAATTALVNGAADVASYGDDIDKAAQKMGMSAEAYQEWDAVMQHSGTSMASLKTAMTTLAKAAVTDKKALEKLGLSQEHVAALSQEELFAETITALQNVEDETERTYLASQLLGGGAKELGALLNTSAEDTQAMKDRVHELGGVLSDEAIAAAAGFQDNLQDMQTAFSGLSRSMLAEFMPGISEVMGGLTEIFSGNSGAGIEQIGAGIASVTDTITAEMPKVLEVGAGIINALIEAITNNLPTLLESGTNAVLMIADGIIQNLPEIIEAALQVILSLSNGIAQSLPELMPTIVDVVMQIVGTLIDNVDMLIDSAIAIILALSDGLMKSLPKLLQRAPEIIQKLVTAIIENGPKLLKAAFELIVSLAKGLIENIPELLKSVVEIVGAIGQGIIDNISQIFDAGKQIVSGLWDGIQEKKDWIKEKVSGFFTGIVDGVKGLLGIQSPSKVFSSIGQFCMKGLESGIDDGAKYAVSATENAISSIEGAAKFSPASFSVPVPALAMGNVIPPNREFLAPAGQAAGQDRSDFQGSRGLSADDIVRAFQAALANMGVYMDRDKVGNLVTKYQRNNARMMGV